MRTEGIGCSKAFGKADEVSGLMSVLDGDVKK